MIGLKFLSLMALVAALLAVQGTFGRSVMASDRTELPSGGSGDSDLDDGLDGTDVTLPPHAVMAPAPQGRGAGGSAEARRAPPPSMFPSRIFRPPISLA